MAALLYHKRLRAYLFSTSLFVENASLVFVEQLANMLQLNRFNGQGRNMRIHLRTFARILCLGLEAIGRRYVLHIYKLQTSYVCIQEEQRVELCGDETLILLTYGRTRSYPKFNPSLMNPPSQNTKERERCQGLGPRVSLRCANVVVDARGTVRIRVCCDMRVQVCDFACKRMCVCAG